MGLFKSKDEVPSEGNYVVDGEDYTSDEYAASLPIAPESGEAKGNEAHEELPIKPEGQETGPVAPEEELPIQ